VAVLKFLSPKRKAVLGVDISSSSVKILELTGDGDKYRVANYARGSLPENAVDGNIVKDIDAVAQTIQDCVSHSKFSTKLAALAVPDSSVITKIIQVDEGLNDMEMEEMVVMEADKYIPYSIDEINIDFNKIGPSAKNPALLDVLLVASRAENVSTRVEAVTRAGLEAKVVDVESYAVERACSLLSEQLPAGGEDKTIAIIDIGAVHTHLFIMHNMRAIFSREEEFGGKRLIDEIINRYNLSFTDALKAKALGTLPDDYEDEILMPFKEMTVIQVKRALQFFFSTSHHSYIDYLLLAGGASKIGGLTELIQSEVGIQTEIANPLLKMAISKKIDLQTLANDAPSLMIPCGLALRMID
jgi:type IV pilus assembly protein PilM